MLPGFTLQPSEFMKIGLIMYLASFMSKNGPVGKRTLKEFTPDRNTITRMTNATIPAVPVSCSKIKPNGTMIIPAIFSRKMRIFLLKIAGIIIVPFGLILEQDTGTAGIVAFVILVMVFLSGVNSFNVRLPTGPFFDMKEAKYMISPIFMNSDGCSVNPGSINQLLAPLITGANLYDPIIWSSLKSSAFIFICSGF